MKTQKPCHRCGKIINVELTKKQKEGKELSICICDDCWDEFESELDEDDE